MLFHFQHDIQIAGWPTIRPGFAFPRDAQARSRVHARRNPQLDGLFALEASLTAAGRATLFTTLSRGLARRACPRDSEKSLRVTQLATATAGLASLNAGAFFRACAVASLAVFLARQLDLGSHSRGGFLERERHVVAQVGSALCSATPATAAASSKQILEAKKISENVVEILEDGAVETLTGACAGKSRVTVGVVNLSLLSVAQDAVSFGALAELHFRLGFVFRIAVRMPLQRRLAVGRFDFVDRCRSRNAQDFVVIPLMSLGHGNSESPLVCCFFRCGTGMHGYAHHRRTENASMKHISWLEHL